MCIKGRIVAELTADTVCKNGKIGIHVQQEAHCIAKQLLVSDNKWCGVLTSCNAQVADSHSQRQTEADRGRQTEDKTKRHRHRQTEADSGTETEAQGHAETDSGTETEADRGTQADSGTQRHTE